MRRVPKNRLGYVGYQCIGCKPDEPPMQFTVMNCDAEGRKRTSGWLDDIVSSTLNYIDNYYNLPTEFEGFISTTNAILNMNIAAIGNTPSTGTIHPPEIACDNNWGKTSAGLISGLYSIYISAISNLYFYVKDGDDEHITLDSSGNNAGCFHVQEGNTDIEYPMGPGLLEPMLDTDLNPVGLDANLSEDLALDGAMLALVQFTKWRISTDIRINDLVNALNNIKSGGSNWHMYYSGLRNIINTSYATTACNQFKIYTNGNPLYEGSAVHPSKPIYNVSGGNAIINGVSIAVTGLSSKEPPFQVYLNITFSSQNEDDGKYSTVVCSLGTEKNGTVSISIGSVIHLSSNGSSDAVAYSLYQITQERCEVNVDIIRTPKPGIIFRDNTGSSPYEAYPTATCDV